MANHKLQPVRGTKDLFGDEMAAFNHITQVAAKLAQNFAFEQLQTPIFEFSEIFERNLGETSDIIAKEVYKFLDRGDNYLTLRPEFTAAIVRALISNGSLQQLLPCKLFSYGPLFRYDRPQKGRQRQFHQVNFEVFGQDNVFCDIELISLARDFLEELAILDKVKLHINSLGCVDSKANYEQALSDYLTKFKADLSPDSQVRLLKNPLRILDSKDKNDQKLLLDAPKIANFYTDQAKNRFDLVLNLLTKLGINYVINNNLVRGLDYYTSLVFEFISDHEGAQNAILAGGRYDNLVAKMGGKDLPAIGFACGIERLMLLADFDLKNERPISINYISENEKFYAFEIAQNLRKLGLKIDFTLDGSFKKQMKRASQNNSRFVVIIGQDEMQNNEAKVKDFDNSSEKTLKIDQLFNYFAKNA